MAKGWKGGNGQGADVMNEWVLNAFLDKGKNL
jgi:hypothetical protein